MIITVILIVCIIPRYILPGTQKYGCIKMGNLQVAGGSPLVEQPAETELGGNSDTQPADDSGFC